MKIAYLVHSGRDYEETVEQIKQLTKQGDHVFIMINDNDLRDKVGFVYADYARVHISHLQEYAQEGDLSLARGTIIQLKEAVELGEFDFFINLTDGMMPLKNRSEIVDFLSKNEGKDFYYEEARSEADLKKKSEKYYPFTNSLDFPTNRFMRGFSKLSANCTTALGFKRKVTDDYRIGSPWFILCLDTAKILAENFDYVSETFKLSWYAEEMYIPMMMNKFVYVNGREDDHINQDLRVIGDTGKWQESVGAKPLTDTLISEHPEALFGGKITTDDNMYLYEDLFDIYNQDYNAKMKEEKKDLDPNRIIDAFLPKNKN